MDNQKLNDYVRQESNGSWDDCKWQIWNSTLEGAYWYIPAYDDYPQQDNIIEGENGELFYLDADDAYLQWYGDGEPSISLDKGLTRWNVDNLSTIELVHVLRHIGESRNSPAVEHACKVASGDTDREWLHVFMRALMTDYIIG